MAGDWIKVEKSTPDKPEIAILARKLGVSPADAFLAWYRVYCWADGVCSSGSVPHLSLSDGDTLSHTIPGTCEALASPEIGWLVEGDAGLEFSNWDRHNGKSAKARALDTEKKRRQRATSRSRPDSNGTQTGTREEKRREDINYTHTHIPKSLQTEGFVDAWGKWCGHFELEHHRPLDAIRGEAELMELAKRGAEKAIRDIEFSIRKGARTILDSDHDYERQRAAAAGGSNGGGLSRRDQQNQAAKDAFINGGDD